MASRPSSTSRPPITARSWPTTCARCINHLELPRADVMGYSMGARITAFLAVAHPQRVRAAVLGGIGVHLVEGVGPAGETIAHGLEAPSRADITDPPRGCSAPSPSRRSPTSGARRVHQRNAPDAEPRRGRARSPCRFSSRSAAMTKSRVRREHWPRSSPTRRRWSFRGATTCSPSATGCSRPGWLEFLARAAMLLATRGPLLRDMLKPPMAIGPVERPMAGQAGHGRRVCRQPTLVSAHRDPIMLEGASRTLFPGGHPMAQ